MSPLLPPDAATPPAKRDFAAVLDWWALAGVDSAFRDEPRGWLEATPQQPHGSKDSLRQALDAAATEAKTTPVNAIAVGKGRGGHDGPDRFGGDRDKWPTDLALFRRWWLHDDSLGEFGAFPRIAPLGSHGAEIMVIVPEPEEADRERLLSGQQGAMAQRVLGAMRIAPASTYFASVLPRHTPLADWRGLADSGLRDIVRHHIHLVAPLRTIVFGREVAGLFESDGTVFCAPGLDELRRSAQRRQRFWQRWLAWSGEDKT